MNRCAVMVNRWERMRLEEPTCPAIFATIDPKKLAYQWKHLKQTSSTRLRSVRPATARPFPPAPEAFPVIAAAARGKSWLDSRRGRVPRVAVQVRGEH